MRKSTKIIVLAHNIDANGIYAKSLGAASTLYTANLLLYFRAQPSLAAKHFFPKIWMEHMNKKDNINLRLSIIRRIIFLRPIFLLIVPDDLYINASLSVEGVLSVVILIESQSIDQYIKSINSIQKRLCH